jgi:hypothetical protein
MRFVAPTVRDSQGHNRPTNHQHVASMLLQHCMASTAAAAAATAFHRKITDRGRASSTKQPRDRTERVWLVFLGAVLEFVGRDDRGLNRPVFGDIRRDLLRDHGQVRPGVPMS